MLEFPLPNPQGKVGGNMSCKAKKGEHEMVRLAINC